MPRSVARCATIVTTALAVLLLVPAAALAHASFDVSQLPVSSTQELVLRVPLERDAVNDLVEVLVPGAFTIDSCVGAEGWTCDQEATAEGDTVLTFERTPGGPGDTERFTLTVAAPVEEGVYAFPTIQTYDDGEEAAWIGEAGSDRPAPRIQVGDETTPVEFSGESTPHTERAEDGPSPEPTTADTPTPSDGPADAPTATDAATGGPSPAATPESPGEITDDKGDGGTLIAIIAVVAVVAVVALVGGLWLQRRQ